MMEDLKVGRIKHKQQRLATVSARHPMAVIMLDLASEQLAGASLAEISSVLYWKVMQWAGYSRDKKIAYFEFMIDRDNKRKEFEAGIKSLTNGKTWEDIQNTPLLAKRFAAQLACKLYSDIWSDTRTFMQLPWIFCAKCAKYLVIAKMLAARLMWLVNDSSPGWFISWVVGVANIMEITIDEAERENERTKEMIGLIKRKTGTKNVLFIIDEVGQYIAGQDSLILNLDGLAKNIKNVGGGHAWIIATAQQTLTEDDPRARYNTAKLFKLKDRFPIEIDLEASDIKEICYLRLLSKSKEGKDFLESLYQTRGEQLRSITKIEGSKLYRSDIDKEMFCKLYPFLPQHFDILLKLLGRLAKTSGGIGLRSVIKVIQDILVDKSSMRRGQILLADKKIGVLANTVTFYDTLYRDIEKSFRFITTGVEKIIQAYEEDSIHAQAAKSIAVLQVLDDFPLTVKNLSALMHPDVESLSRYDEIKKAIDELLKAADMPINEVDGNLRFMSEIITDLEKKKQELHPGIADLRSILTQIYQIIFTPAPSATIYTSKKVQTGLKFDFNRREYAFSGDREEIQCTIKSVKNTNYEDYKKEIIKESMEAGRSRHFYVIAPEEEELEATLREIFQCQEITKQKSHERAEYGTGCIKYLSERLTKEFGKGFDKNLSTLKFNIENVNKDVTNLLDAEKIDQIQFLYDHNSILDITNAVKQEIGIFKSVTRKKEINMILSYEDSLFVKINTSAFTRIMNNLLENAINHTQKGGEIIVSLRSDASHIYLIIKDTGTGIPEKNLNKLFKAYYQVKKQKKCSGRLGIGLYLVKNIVDAVGGEIKVHSVVGKGSMTLNS